ncbi:MAG: endonuclease/exonuclease/phosphatase family protein [Salinisphaeraceae bacterium]|nr:endonuclease/exonuclease/phosphatase family protein [Salinisphaeraceae bacterium]
MPKAKQDNILRLMTYNIQVGIRSRSYGEYLRNSWRHVLPGRKGTAHLEPIAGLLKTQDIVGIQEADAGSYRTRSVNLLHFLAQSAGFEDWHLHGHRRFGKVARHGMGLLSRYQIESSNAHALPGRVPGRAAVVYQLKARQDSLTIVLTHLALSRRDRSRQLSYIGETVEDAKHLILMGDLNCEPQELHQHPWLRSRGLHGPDSELHSHPSWRPNRQIDHILASPELNIVEARAEPFCWSDHLPVLAEIQLPGSLQLEPAKA